MFSLLKRQLYDLRQRLARPRSFTRYVTNTFLIQMISLVIVFAYNSILARTLGTEGKGVLQIVELLPIMLSLFLSGGIEVANVYFVGFARMSIKQLSTNTVAHVIIAFVLGCLLVAGLASTGWLETLIPGVPIWLMAMSLFILPLEMLRKSLIAILRGKQLFITVNALNLFYSVSLLICTVMFVVIAKAGIPGALLANGTAALLSLLLTIKYIWQQGGSLRPRWRQDVMGKVLSFGMKGYFGNLLQYYNYRLDNFIVNYYLGSSDLGLYSISVRVAELLWNFPNAVGSVIFPKAASTKTRQLNVMTPKVFRITLVVTAIGAIGLAIIGKSLIRLLFSNSFIEAYQPMLILLPGTVLLGAGKVLTNEIAGRGYPHYNSVNSAIALLLTIILNLLFIPRWGISGAAFASTLAYSLVFVTSVLAYVLVKRKSADTLQEG